MSAAKPDPTPTLRPSMLARSALYIAGMTVLAAVLGPLGATTGLLDPLLGFLLFAAAMTLGALLSLLLGVVGLLATRARGGSPPRRGRGAARAAIVIGGVLTIALALLAGRSGGVPPIHDVTTDPDDPPAFQTLAYAGGNESRDLDYPNGRSDTTALQRDAYPDLGPIRIAAPPAEALRRAAGAARELGWEVVAEDEGRGLLEATSTSRIFRFVDDIVVRVRPDGEGSVIDLRSTSRVGESDLGANAARIRAFRDRLGGGRAG